MHDKKQADYGKTGDPFSNVRASEDFGVPGWVGCMMRANDKMRRIQKAATGGTMANEAVEDSFRDLAVYAIIGLCLFEETTQTKIVRREPLNAQVGGLRSVPAGSLVMGGIVIDSSLDREVEDAFAKIQS